MFDQLNQVLILELFHFRDSSTIFLQTVLAVCSQVELTSFVTEMVIVLLNLLQLDVLLSTEISGRLQNGCVSMSIELSSK